MQRPGGVSLRLFCPLLAAVLLAVLGGCEDRRPKGSPEDAAEARILLVELRRIHTQLAALLDEYKQIEQTVQELDAERDRAAQRWQTDSERQSPEYLRQRQAFEKKSAALNARMQAFNEKSAALAHLLAAQSPAQVTALTRDIAELIRAIDDALADGQYYRAAYLAERSPVLERLSSDH